MFRAKLVNTAQGAPPHRSIGSPNGRSEHMKIRLKHAALVAGVFLLIAISGCDSVQESDFVTLPIQESFTLEFDGAALDPIKPADKHSEPESIVDDLSGFTKEAITAAGIASIQVERIQPPGADLSSIAGGQLTVYLEATGAGRVQIGQIAEVPDANSINVPVVLGGQIVPLLKAQDYRVALSFVPADNPPDETIRLNVDVDFEVTFDGP